MIKPEPGAIYRVEFTIKKAYSLYKCDASAEEEPEAEEPEEEKISLNMILMIMTITTMITIGMKEKIHVINRIIRIKK